jgi:hypothetical protein
MNLRPTSVVALTFRSCEWFFRAHFPKGRNLPSCPPNMADDHHPINVVSRQVKMGLLF